MTGRRGWAASGVLGVELDRCILMEKHGILRRHGEGMNEHFARLQPFRNPTYVQPDSLTWPHDIALVDLITSYSSGHKPW